jgi:probable F420-dependent oxidoreductase
MGYVRDMTNINDRGVDRDAVRARLGRVGAWLGPLGRLSAARERDVAQEIEALGYPALWITESNKEIFAHSSVVLGATSTLTIASGIANVWAREPETLASGADVLNDAYDGRFVLGIGIGHANMVARYDKPLATMRGYLDRMLDHAGGRPTPSTPVPWLIAALRPKMLELAATKAQGSHPYFVPVEHTVDARAALGPDALLAPELAVVLDTDPTTARATARRYMATYLGLANYTNNLRTLGYTDDDLAGGGSDRLVDAVIAWGDVDAIKRRVDEHLDAGADHVCVQPLDYSDPADGRYVPLEHLTELAPALLG